MTDLTIEFTITDNDIRIASRTIQLLDETGLDLDIECERVRGEYIVHIKRKLRGNWI